MRKRVGAGRLLKDKSIQLSRGPLRVRRINLDLFQSKFEPLQTLAGVWHRCRALGALWAPGTSRENGRTVRLPEANLTKGVRPANSEDKRLKLPEQKGLVLKSFGVRRHGRLGDKNIKKGRDGFGKGGRNTLIFMDNQADKTIPAAVTLKRQIDSEIFRSDLTR